MRDMDSLITDSAIKTYSVGAERRGASGAGEGSRRSPLQSAIEALLFVTDEPVSVMTLAEMLNEDTLRVQRELESLQRMLIQEQSGIQLRELAGGWRLTTHPMHHELIERYVISWDTRKLTQAALETLAIVAYCQPITRNGVASVRGVNSDSSINSLVEKGLLREVGCADTPGNPVLYGTTKTFLEHFGLTSVGDLPALETFAPDEETRAFIAERLNVINTDDVRMHMLEDEDSEYQEEKVFDSMQDALQMALDTALAQGAGVVEKIDFSTLTFSEDDE